MIIGFVALYILPSLANALLARSQTQIHIQKIERNLAYPIHDVTIVSQSAISKYPEVQSGIIAADKKYGDVEELCRREPIWCSDNPPLGRPPPDEIAHPFATVYISYDKAKKLVMDEEFGFQPGPNLEKPNLFETYIEAGHSIYNIRVINPFTFDEWVEMSNKRQQL